MIEPQNVLRRYFGYESFRPMQEEIITHILQKKDCLVLMPTGGGKSICFQIPALLMEGTAIVVSPLISLMKDQVESLRANGIPAAALNSNASEAENREIADKAIKGEFKLLYISPEKLLSEIKFGILRNSCGNNPQGGLKVSIFAIDEAHCISSWGHDFRPEYTQLGELRSLFPQAVIAAFTATADKITKADIVEQLRLQKDSSGETSIFISSFDRPNLSLDVRRGFSAKDKQKFLLSLIQRHNNESGVVYCLSRKTTEKVAQDLCAKGINAKAYHAGMSAKERDEVQEDFINERISVVCATIAFGMGIDKSNVRFVVHYNMPKSIENYYQEIGRGGRDGLPCETVLFYNVGDIITLRQFADESGQRSINNEKLDRMQEYAESQICRRRILLNYFGETMACDCDNCDICNNPPERFDGTQLVQKALSAIMRVSQKEGFHMIIDILRGSQVYDLIQKGYHQLTTWGCGRDVAYKDWQDYLLQMLHLGYIEIDYKDSSHLKITDLGKDVLYGRASAQLAVITHEDFTVSGRKRKIMESRLKDVQADQTPETKVLFEKLRQLRLQIAGEMKVPPYVVFSDKSLREMACFKPESVAQFINISGVSVNKQNQFGVRFVKAIRNFLGKNTEEDGNWDKVEPLTKKNENVLAGTESKLKDNDEPRKRVVHDFVTIKGVQYHIDLDDLKSMNWRSSFDLIGKDLYFNLWKESIMPMSRYIDADVENHDRVVLRFVEIIKSAYGLNVTPDNQWVIIPLRVEYDVTGMPVHTLECSSFEDGLEKFKSFIEEHHHYPFTGSDEYECSLRRWYQEVSRGIFPITETQRQAFETMLELYKDVPKVRGREV